MSLHDEYARLTPFEIAFPGDSAFPELLANIRTEATERGLDPSNFQEFMSLTNVGEALKDFASEDQPPGAVHRYGGLLFHGVSFATAGSHLFLLETGMTRHLIEHSASASPRPPASAGYLQLPQHLVWSGGASEQRPESLDGMFWAVSGSGSFHVMIITGLLPERPGFGAFTLPEVPVVDASQWLSVQVREVGSDFASTLEGGELDQLYSVETAGEILKLLARFFAYVSDTGELVETSPAPADGRGPRASHLPYVRVQVPESGEHG